MKKRIFFLIVAGVFTSLLVNGRTMANLEVPTTAEELKNNDLYNKIVDFSVEGKYKQALSLVNNLFKKNPDDKVLMLRTRIYMALKDYDRALHDISVLIKRNYTDDKNLYWFMGQIYLNIGKHIKALKVLEKEETKQLKNKYFLNDLAMAYLKNNNPEKAIVYFKKAIDLDKSLFFSYHGLGAAKQQLKQLDDALVAYDMALAINPKHVQSYNNRATIYIQKENLQKALKDLNKAVKLDSSIAQVYHNLGKVYHSSQEPKEALVNFKKAVKLDKNNAKYYVSLGQYYEDEVLLDKACEAWRKALELGEKVAEKYIKKTCYD